MIIFTGFAGPEIWTASPLGFENNKFLLLAFTAISGVTVFYHTRKILEKMTDKFEYFLKTRFTIAFILITWFIHLCRPSYYTYAFLFVLSLNASKITILCQLAHATSREFQPIRLVNLGIVVIYFLCFALSIFGSDINSIKYVLVLASTADFVNFAIMITKKMSDILGIQIFTVGGGAASQAPTVRNTSEVNLEGENFKKVQNQHDSMPDEGTV